MQLPILVTPQNAPLFERKQLLGIALLTLFFLFSNLIDRVVGLNIAASASFYVILCLAIVWSCVIAKLRRWQLGAIGLALYFLLLPLLNGEGVQVAVSAAKDLSLPLLVLVLGYTLLSKRAVFNILNGLFLLYVLYGLLQAWCFFSGTMQNLIPWDAAYIDQMKAAGLSVFQTASPSTATSPPRELLRLFGTMNSFFHYQLIAAIIPLFLWVYRAKLSSLRLLRLNTILAVVLLVVVKERTPLVMLGLVFLTYVTLGARQSRKFGALGLTAVLLVAVGISYEGSGYRGFGKGREYVNQDVNESDAQLRMRNTLELRLDQDPSTKERMSIWQDMLREIDAKNAWLGKSVGLVLPSTDGKTDNRHLSPHNFYLFFILAYGVLGLVLYFGFLLKLTLSASTCKGLSDEKKLLLIGLLAGYLFVGMFHLIFLSKLGVIFFWILGVTLAECDRAEENLGARCHSLTEISDGPN